MNTEMASTLGCYPINELYVTQVARNRWVPNKNDWAFLMITLIIRN